MLDYVFEHEIFPRYDAGGREVADVRDFYTTETARLADGVVTDIDAHAAVTYVDHLVRPSAARFAQFCETVAGGAP